MRFPITDKTRQDDATFSDPLTKAEGRKQYEAQWYGLKAAFSEIEQLSQSVTSSGNPITMDLKTRYKVKGVGAEKIIESVIKIQTDPEGKKIVAVEDRWNGNIPEGAIATVSVFQLLNPLWWGRVWGEVAFCGWSFVWWTKPWEVGGRSFLRLLPLMISHRVGRWF